MDRLIARSMKEVSAQAEQKDIYWQGRCMEMKSFACVLTYRAWLISVVVPWVFAPDSTLILLSLSQLMYRNCNVRPITTPRLAVHDLVGFRM